jgi:hypothetical protein
MVDQTVKRNEEPLCLKQPLSNMAGHRTGCLTRDACALARREAVPHARSASALGIAAQCREPRNALVVCAEPPCSKHVGGEKVELVAIATDTSTSRALTSHLFLLHPDLMPQAKTKQVGAVVDYPDEADQRALKCCSAGLGTAAGRSQSQSNYTPEPSMTPVSCGI